MGKAIYDEITIAEQATAPGSPPSGFYHIYPKPDGKLYGKNSSGVEFELSNFNPVVTTVTAATHNETATVGILKLICNATSNNITVNLPTAIGNKCVVTIKKVSANNSVTIDGLSVETIDGGLTAVLTRLDESITIYSDNTNWKIE